MRRLTSSAVLFFAFLGLLAVAGPATSATPQTERPVAGGDLSMLDFNVKAYRVPATGMVFSNLHIKTPRDSTRQDVTLRMRSSNPHVFTPRFITLRGIQPGTTKRFRVAIQPGRKARGKATITVTNGELLVTDTITVTRPTPGAGAWRKP